jgi:hypothetical protein
MAVANQTPPNVASDYALTAFIVGQLMAGMATATIVKVVKCTNEGGVSASGFVDVQPLVNMMTGDRTAVPHKVLYSLPYSRLQGGANAIILDPQPGDLGIAVFASRDISAVKKSKAQANPGSSRQYNLADGMYIGGLLNGAPTQYVQFSAEGVTVVSPTAIKLQAPTITLDGAVHGTHGATFANDVTAEGISVHDHTHGGVSPGGSNTAPPNP